MSHENIILDDPSISYWLKDQITLTNSRDPNDVLNDIEILKQIVEIRLLTTLKTAGVQVQCDTLSGSLVQL